MQFQKILIDFIIIFIIFLQFMDNATFGNNSMFRSPLARQTPNFMTRPIGQDIGQTFRPQQADLNRVNPMFREVYQRFNDSLSDLQRSEDLSRNQANQSRDMLANNYNRSVQQAEQQRIADLDQVRRANKDAQTANRVRARAIGGDSSSGFLDLANRIDQDAQQNVFKTNTGASNRISEAEQNAFKAFADIENRLNDAIAKIESDRRLSLRERDSMVRELEEQAARRALAAAQMAGMYGQGGDEQQQGRQGSVMGLNFEVEVPDGVNVLDYGDTQDMPGAINRLNEIRGTSVNPNINASGLRPLNFSGNSLDELRRIGGVRIL